MDYVAFSTLLCEIIFTKCRQADAWKQILDNHILQ